MFARIQNNDFGGTSFFHSLFRSPQKILHPEFIPVQARRKITNAPPQPEEQLPSRSYDATCARLLAIPGFLEQSI